MPQALAPDADSSSRIATRHRRTCFGIPVAAILLPLLTGFWIAPSVLGFTPSVELVYRGPEPIDESVALTDFAYDESSSSYYLPTGGFDHQDKSVGAILRMDAMGSVETFIQFTGESGSAKGRLPRGAVTRGPDGKFYGVTRAGGREDKGTVFRFSSTGEFETLAEFSGTGAAHPTGTLLRAPDGFFYGVTTSGGSHGVGTVFRMSTLGGLSHFAHLNESSGRHPVDGLALGSDGAFYGMTDEGGLFRHGTIYKVTSEGNVSAVVHFSGNGAVNRGRKPYGKLLSHPDGFLYGVTQRGGSEDRGTVFKLGTDGKLTTLFANFDSTFSFPSSSLVPGQGGMLYGLTASRRTYLPDNENTRARVFTVTPSGQVTAMPPLPETNAALTLGGGQTSLFPRPDGSFFVGSMQSVFLITRNGTFSTQYDFPDFPVLTSILVGADGTLSGSYEYTNYEVPVHSILLFNLDRDARLRHLSRFTTRVNAQPLGNAKLALDPEGRIHGAIRYPTPVSTGDLFFSITPGGNAPIIRDPVRIANTIQLLAGSNGSVYVLAEKGLFHVPQTGSIQTLLSNPTYNYDLDSEGITWGPDGAIYGVTRVGGAFGEGRLYRCTTDGEVTTLYHFGNPNGSIAPITPYGSVAFGEDGSIYGVATIGPWTNGYVYRYSEGVMRVVAVSGHCTPLARGADGRIYTIRQRFDPLVDYPIYGNIYGSGEIEILSFAQDLSITTIPVHQSALTGPVQVKKGLTPGPDGTLYFFLTPYDYNHWGSNAVYRLYFGQPIVALSPVSELTANGAVLSGMVDSRGNPETVTHFEFGVSASQMRLVPVVPGADQIVVNRIHGLQPDTEYFYRLRSTNSGGTVQTSIATFRTPPGNKLPEFSPFLVRTTAGSPTLIPMDTLLAAMTDPDGGVPSVASVHSTSDRGGTVSLVEGAGLSFQPSAGFAGMDTVSLDMTDSQGGLVTVFVPVMVDLSTESESSIDHIGLLGDGRLLIVLQGEAGKPHVLQKSTDLRLWEEARSATAAADGSVVVIEEAPPKSTTYFRLALPQ